MSIARHHAEWLSLVPVSGPFLSLPVLMEAFPQGLDAHDADHARLLRLAFEEWDDSQQQKKFDPTLHDAWIKFVLTSTLEYDESLLAEGQAISQTLQVEVPEHGEFLRPSLVLNDPTTGKARMLIRTYPRSQELGNYVAGSRWKASPDTRMTELLHATGVRLGLVTNGEHWMLVDAPTGETTGYASWYASLWREEKITLQAFRSLLSMSRLFGVSDDQTLEALLAKSANNQQEVTTQLGAQVLRAVEVLIQSLDKADQDHERSLLEGVSEAVLYESALTVMMRLVFLFCAEERELIPTKPFPVYEQNYSVSTISKQLREIADQHGEELLERRFDAWPRVLSAFRAVYGGLAHDDVYMPAYGGRLFDPDRFPFLEGRQPKTKWQQSEASPLPVNNRTVLHLLEALQLLQVKVPGGGPAEARRLSFRALDIEQIGHVYEGLLDHTAKRATETMLGLMGKKEPEISLQKLEAERAKGDNSFFEFLKNETGGNRKWAKYLDQELDETLERRLRTACGNDDALYSRVRPFAKLIRDDSFGYPVVIAEKSVFVTSGTDRRSSGTHYTPRSLTEPIVQYTLEPLVYIGPAEGTPKQEWKLKSAAELLDLKICDMACGSGAFLVQAARYMSERLMEAWEAIRQANPEVPGITPEGHPSTGAPNESLIPTDPAEQKTYALRIVVQRCLYGVDINPLAAEMAKLSLWLLTLAKDKPFEFLDHAIRCGDSLVGLHDIEQLKVFSLKPDAADEAKFYGPLLSGVDEAIQLRLDLADHPAATLEEVKEQVRMHREAEDKMARLRCAADLLVAAEFWGEGTKDKQELVRHAAVVAGQYVEHGPTEEFQEKAERERRGQKMFHWPLEFPEVIVKRGGFDIVVENPPYMGGKKVTKALGTEYRSFVLAHIAGGRRGNADVCAYFFLRALQLLRSPGSYGLVATTSMSEGETREVGLDQVDALDCCIVKADQGRAWPGLASVTYLPLWIYKGTWNGSFELDSTTVNGITPYITDIHVVTGNPQRLAHNQRRAFIGSFVYGEGFVISPSEAQKLLTEDSRNQQVVFPYLRGGDFNDSPTLSPAVWVINFYDWPLDKARGFEACFRIVEERVRPEREKLGKKHDASAQTYAKLWWQYGRRGVKLYQAIVGLDRVLFHCFTSKHIAFGFVPTDIVFAAPHVVIALERYEHFAVLQSSLHESWVRHYTSYLSTSARYTPSDCFETFPLPETIMLRGNTVYPTVDSLGKAYYEQRHDLMRKEQIGLTALYNFFHDPMYNRNDFDALRVLHAELDRAVATAYEWDDLDLDHNFHETKQGIRFTISEAARREILQRLLKLNHERYEEEVRQGLHDKKGKKAATQKKATKKRAADSKQVSLFDTGGE